MSGIIRRNEFPSDIDVDCLVIGGGAAGLTAALAAHEAGATVLIAERETRLSGSTALSSGLIPAAGTRAQQAQQIDFGFRGAAAGARSRATAPSWGRGRG